MIEYDFKYIKENLELKGFTLNYLREEKILSQSTLSRLRHNEPVNTKTINIICGLIGCVPKDIMRYVQTKYDVSYINSLERPIYGRNVTDRIDNEKDPWEEKTFDGRNVNQ